ncbi:glycosyltransferase family 4 protein [Leptolyngbya sp. NIES-2104]|uniref:glycosyltransferase family 4 protein n=1 Tax=Leptolyngbya sp. NIES-2104 TaxID=1552121 RepID=UPI0006ECB6C2|nr:glycosyltransferase family 4 protein [Leptolyngbya sp. NIES-2104]GAP97596.1 transcriptional regulator [Leptolyngbya sp. NIES-2104]
MLFSKSVPKEYNVPSHGQLTRLMIFGLKVSGHHPTHIRHLIEYFCEHKFPDYLDFVVAPAFLEAHPDIVQLVSEDCKERVRFIPITEAEFRTVQQKRSLYTKLFAEWNLLCQVARKLQATQILLLYFDHLQLPIAFGQKAPCPVAGIYFRPTFHYAQFPNFRFTWKEALRQWRKKNLLQRVLQSRQVNLLFSLDPYAIPAIVALSPSVRVCHIPDPIELDTISSEIASQRVIGLRSKLGIEPNRKVLLLFGRVRYRKGTAQLLDSIQYLSAQVAEKICVLIVGEVPAQEQSKLQESMQAIKQSSAVQVILQAQYVAESEVKPYFQLADVVLTPYQRHVGMSNILVQAAAVQKPVLGSNYGVMGKLIEEHELGLTIDSEKPSEIANGIARILSLSPETLCNHQKMEALVQLNLAEKFAEVLCSGLLNPSSKTLSTTQDS